MYTVKSENIEGFTFDVEIPKPTDVGVFIVAGTHSAGKTTLINDYIRQAQPEDEAGAAYYTIPTEFYAYYEHIGNTVVPVVAAPEGATLYADKVAKNPGVLTDGYTIEHQIGMEAVTKRQIVRAMVIASNLAARLQPDRATPIAGVVSDRSQLDGHIYSWVRAPEAEQEFIDMIAVAQVTGGKPPDLPINPWPYRQFARYWINDICSLAFVVNHSEVTNKSTIYRSSDSELRDRIAKEITTYYQDVLGDDRIIEISGTPTERLTRVTTYIREILGAQLAQTD